MKQFTQFAVILSALAFVAAPSAGQGGKAYLDANGNLTQMLQVKQLQGGFAGDTGWLYKVEKNGAWKKFNVFNQRLTLKGQGMFDANQRKALAEQLAKYNVKELPAKTGKPTTNRQLLTIQYGKNSSSFIFGAGTLLPKADADTVAGRFGGVVQAMIKMTKGKPVEQE